MLIYLIPAGLLIVVGALLMFAPEALQRINEVASRTVARVDEKVLLHRVTVGVILWLVGALVLFTGYLSGF